jgi:hypothetical protein
METQLGRPTSLGGGVGSDRGESKRYHRIESLAWWRWSVQALSISAVNDSMFRSGVEGIPDTFGDR